MNKKWTLFIIFLIGVGLLIYQTSEQIGFAFAFLTNPKQVGAIAPSSKYLGQESIRFMDTTEKPLRVLEVGAGTGTITEVIVKKLRPIDQLDIIELEPNFCKILEEKFGTLENIHIHCVSILDWKPAYRYDLIVSALPFNAFSPTMVKEILTKYAQLAKRHGHVAYFEYIALPWIRSFFLNEQEKQTYAQSAKHLKQFREKHQKERRRVFLNIPPAYVHHLKIKK